MDIEITTICGGPEGTPCPFCYKGNTSKGDYMSFDIFKKVSENIPFNTRQIAFGVDATCTSNPDVWKIMEYCREKGVVPNVTVANISDEVADKLASLCGAVAVSRYKNKDICYDSVKKLTDRGMDQVNIHTMISEETFDQTMETIDDINTDGRLSKLNAIVFLSLKQQGRGKNFTPLSYDKFKTVIKSAFKNKIGHGFDSCTASKYYNAASELGTDRKVLDLLVESCESTLFSAYVNVYGKFFPCSFVEGTSGWEEGIDLTSGKVDFWNHELTNKFRDTLLKNVDSNKIRFCPVFNV